MSFVDIRTKKNRSCETLSPESGEISPKISTVNSPEISTVNSPKISPPTQTPKKISALNKLIIKIGNNDGDQTHDWVRVHLRNKNRDSCKTLDLNYNSYGWWNFNIVGETLTIDANINEYISHEALAECFTGSFRPDEELWMKLELSRPAGSLWVWDRITLSGVEAYFGNEDVWISNEKVSCPYDPCDWFQLERNKLN